MDREEVIAAIRKATEELGYVPSMKEMNKISEIGRHGIRRYFISYRAALVACGLERKGTYRLPVKALFADWAEVVRKLRKIPTESEYVLHGKYTYRPFLRVFGKWKHVAAGLVAYAKEEGLEAIWQDALDVVANHLGDDPRKPSDLHWSRSQPTRRKLMENQTVYGTPLAMAPMVFQPTNEAGVSVLFGAVHCELGFSILQVQNGFPDCEAMQEIEPGRCQRKRIEFEFQSRNFLAHLHPLDGCDMIVCWENNWADAPMEVLELKSAVAELIRDGRFQMCRGCRGRR
jgi:Homing endonuclease associated repeat